MKHSIAILVLVLLGGGAIAAACDENPDGTSRPTPAPTGRIIVDAPIDDLEVLTLESFPVQYNLRIVSGLPSGCAKFDKAEVIARSGNEITVRVTNTLPDDPNIACTAIYGTKETMLPLGTGFNSRETYSVSVNDKSVDFTAQ